ncbi:MAG: hypothetical protein M3R69_07745 [Acidobacteriota bacterium]|nr:hypothetical protein [Acidobacteriota bacterium]
MRNSLKLQRSAGRILSASALLFLLVVTANAYTIVMRSGRRVEIPSRFVVTPATLTYEVATGIQITLEMAAINIPATERANNEAPGSLLKRINTAARQTVETADSEDNVAPTTPTPRRSLTITNRDLEATARRRRDSEVAYENRRKQLGLPSVEESRRRAAAESEVLQRDLGRSRIAETGSENYWRTRATDLRTEMAVVDAELQYIRGRLDEDPFPNSGGWSSGSVTTVSTTSPYGIFGQSSSTTWNRRQVGIGQVGTAGIGIYPNIGVLGPYPSYDFSYERSALITRFNQLAGTRAGLNVRWRALEEEARRAGAPPGWLRP